MAQKVEVHLEDDLDGGPAEHTVTITLDSKNYEIDLSDPNAEKLRETLRPYAAAGRKASRATGARGSGTRSLSADPDPAKIRIWEGPRPPGLRPRPHFSVRQGHLLRRPLILPPVDTPTAARLHGPCALESGSSRHLTSPSAAAG